MNSTGNARPVPPGRLGLVLIVLIAAQFIVVLDFSVVQIALPTIRSEFGVSLADLQWVVSAYGLTFAGFLLLSGRASDIYGRRRLFIAGLVLFSAASAACGFAQSELVLVAARTVQGVAAAIISATGLSLIVVTFAPIGQLARVMGIFTAVSSAGFAAGVVLGGLLTETLGWRYVFFINVPIGILAAVLAPRLLPESRGQAASRRLDVPGAVSVTAGVMLLVYALSNIASGNLSFVTPTAFALAALLLVGFFAIESRSAAPLMPLGFLRRGSILMANSIALVTFGSITGMTFLLTIYLQQLRGYSPLSTGLAFIPPALIFFVVGGFLAARMVSRIGVRRLMIGATILQTASVLLMTQISLNSDYFTTILPAFILLALGGAPGFTAITISALSSARQGEEGLASGMINTSSQLGGPIGLALVVTIVGVVAQSLGGGIASGPETMITGFQYAFGGAATLSAIGFLLALRVKEQKVAPESTIPEGALQPSPLVPTPSIESKGSQAAIAN
jgi:EmrB/QacA subfamily drug resistance transporter